VNAYCLVFPLAVALVAAGCQERATPDQAPLTPQARQQYAELRGLQRSQEPALKAEFERLVAERSMPLDLKRMHWAETSVPTAPDGGKSAPGGGEESAAARLAKTFPPFTRTALAEQLASVYPRHSFAWGPAQLTKAREIRRRYEVARQKFREDLAYAEQGFGLSATDGPLADLAFLSALEIGCRLEGTLAADALADGQPDEALTSVQVMLHAAALSSREWNLTCRLAAARLRQEALQAFGAVIAHPQATQTTQQRAAELLTQQTTNWAPDAQAWIGDRASGLIAYELVRSGYYLSLLSREETAELTRQEVLQVTARAAVRNIDADEAFYLAAIRRLIEACRMPFHDRQPVLQALRAELDALENTPAFPLVAGRLLLLGFEDAMRRQAEDLARCQAWLLALNAALDRTIDESEVNSLTGLPFHLERKADGVRVSGVIESMDEPVFVPTRPAVRTARSNGRRLR
jgi:hypothetical protein